VSENRRLQATDNVPLDPGEPKPPTGTRRIKSATNTTARQKSTSNVAVIDTGIKLNHADLNAAAGKDCIGPGTSQVDGHGHGTHVAGDDRGAQQRSGGRRRRARARSSTPSGCSTTAATALPRR
jgi:subtilisin family serine protease